MAHRNGWLSVVFVCLFVVVTGLLLAGAVTAERSAQSCVVPGSHASIQAAVDDPGCSRVQVGGGTFSENVVISRTVTIEGQGASKTIVDGRGSGSVFNVKARNALSQPMTMTVTINGLSMINGEDGLLNEAWSTDPYAGPMHANLLVNISHSDIRANSVSGVHSRPGASGYTKVFINESTVGGNSSWGLFNDPQWSGSAYLLVTNSTVSDNDAGGIASWGCIREFCEASLQVSGSTVNGNSGSGIDVWAADTLVTNSTISGNTAVEGGGINSGFATLTQVRNSTISGNTAANGGGIATVCGTLHLDNSTVSGNSADSGGAITIFGEDTSDSPFMCYGLVRATHSIVANSENGGDCVVNDEEWASLIDNGHNMVGDGSCIDAPTSFAGDPLLGPLAANGGRTLTHALLPASPAIDAGDAATCPETDQRGYSRPADGDLDGTAECDIGSFELRHMPYSFYLPPVMAGD